MISKIIDNVKLVLSEYPDSRDCDLTLILRYYKKFYGINPKETSIQSLFKSIKSGNLPTLSSIERARRKVQEENVSLRGTVYNTRQRLESEVREEINQLTNG